MAHPPSPSRPERVLVVGGGLVGCALALFLVRRGLRVTVYERNPDPRKALDSRRPSLSLSLCGRGIRSLERLGVMPRIRPLLAPAYGRMIHTPDGRLSYQAYSVFGDAIECVSRHALGAELLSAAEERGVEILFERRCVGVDPEAGAVEVVDANGGTSRDQARAVFAADGASSTVRSHLSRLQMCDVSQTVSDERYQEFRVSPARAAAAGLDADKLHGWPRADLIVGAFPDPRGGFSGTLHMALTGPCSFASLSGADLTAWIRRECPDLADAVPDLAEQCAARRPNALTTVKCCPWSAGGTVLLLGDAAHAMLPYYGQGANAGLEDCGILDDLIERFGTDWPRVFREFESIRPPNTDAMAALCHDHLTVLRDDVSRTEYQERWRLEQELHRLMPDLFTPLYSMIAFSTIPYAEARQRDRLQQPLLRELSQDGAVARARLSPAAAATLRRRVRASLWGVHDATSELVDA